MDSRNFLAILIITNGKASNLKYCFDSWISVGFEPGKDLFLSGPLNEIVKRDICKSAIIDYIDSPYSPPFFPINMKKFTSCCLIESDYIYIVHDRFTPSSNFKSLADRIRSADVDFGAVDIRNRDGSYSLTEIRVRKNVLNSSLSRALERKGRLVCDLSSFESSDSIALNGGQFFIKRTLVHLLARPLRWMELEDDILSYDLLDFNGKWFSEFHLTTQVDRKSPNSTLSIFSGFKYCIYSFICNSVGHLLSVYSVGRNTSDNRLIASFDGSFYLIDPLHKASASDYLPSSLEKLLARSRILSNGSSWNRVEKKFYGWKLFN